MQYLSTSLVLLICLFVSHHVWLLYFNQRAWTVTSFCLVPFMSLYVSPCFSSLLGFISSLPQLAWDKMLCCCCITNFISCCWRILCILDWYCGTHSKFWLKWF
jgi:hypothetical protein